MTMETLPADPHSFANPNEARVTALELFWDVDFERREIRGAAKLRVRRALGATRLILDVRDLAIARVGTARRAGEGLELRWAVGPTDPIRGSALEIVLPPEPAAADLDVWIGYRTVPAASGLQWLDASQTHDRTRPYLFSQAQAIHARSFVPCQDTPGVRLTYEAEVRVPPGFTAVMSAEGGAAADTPGLFRFRQPRPIPAYLLAIAVGDLAFRTTGPRTGVWAEPGVVASAASEFRDLEAMVDAVEAMFGPYRFGRYDLLVLPPSFPFGGMENPNMTFATPTLLAGDRSLVSVVAHELAHSWSGNLVTNAVWADFWLNEGFTVYLERRIVERLYGKETATRQSILGRDELVGTMVDFKDRPKLRRLKVDLCCEDPDDGMNSVPYEKGCLLLTAIERAVGRDRFDPFLRAWFDEHAFKPATTEDFVAFLRGRLPQVEEQLDLALWIHGEALPPEAPQFDRSVFTASEAAAADFAAGRRAASALGADRWTTDEWLHFFGALPAELPVQKLAELDAAWALTDRGNAEIAAMWLGRAIRADYAPAYGRLESFLTSIGRRKFLKPLYAEMLRTPGGRARAEAIYKKARDGYHPIARTTLDRMFEGK
jgi:leukotriene-A4 hydrolase